MTDPFIAGYEAEEQQQQDTARTQREATQKRSAARKQKLNGKRKQALEELGKVLYLRPEQAEHMVVPGKDGAFALALNEDNIARVFAHQFGGNLRFDHARGQWHVWDQTRWKPDRTDLALDYARQLCRSLNLEGRKAFAKGSTFAAIERMARADRMFAVRGDEWDTDPMLLGTPAGTVDLRTGGLRPANPADLITRSTAVAPDEGEPALWRQFLAQATQQDEELELYLRQVAGYSLTGDTREECLFNIYGAGGNGKGTFVGTLHAILGDYATAATMDTFLASRHERHSTDLAMLHGARLVVASETQSGRAWDEQRVKAITGGDPITARFMRQDNFTYRPTFKLLLTSNHKPTLKGVDDAWRRRIRVVPFAFRPERPDPTLKERLKAEYPRILQWAIEGCLDWQQHGLTVPARVRRETAGYFEAQDLFKAWLDEHCALDPTRAAEQPELYRRWKTYAEAAGEPPGTSRGLGDMLETAGFQRVKDTMGIRGRGFVGLQLKALG